MATETYRNLAPLTPRSLLLIVFVVALVAIPLWAFRGQRGNAPGLAGEWIGTVHLSKHISGIGKSEPVNLDGTIYLKLEVYDGIVGRYRGPAEMTFAGSQARIVHIDTLDLPNNGPRVSGMLSGDLDAPGDPKALDVGRDFQGSATPDQITFHTIDDSVTRGYIFRATLHRGTRAEYNNQH